MNEMISLHPEATHLTGYWSGKTVQVNNTDKVLILNESLATADAIELVASFHKPRVANWLDTNRYICTEIERKMSNSVLCWETLPTFANDLVYYGPNPSPLKTFRNICQRLGDEQAATQEIRRAWLEEGLPKGCSAFRLGKMIDLKDHHATMLFNICHLVDFNLDSILADLLTIHNANSKDFAPDGIAPYKLESNKDAFLSAKERILSSPVGPAFKRLFPDAYEWFSSYEYAMGWKSWLRIKSACSQWLLLGALKKYWLLPKNCEAFTASLTSLLREQSEKIGEWDKILEGQSHTPPWLASLYARSTVRNIDDTPTDILEYIDTKGVMSLLKPVLSGHSNTPPFPVEMLQKRHRKKKSQVKMYSVEWAEDNLSAAWVIFFKLWHRAVPNLTAQNRGKIGHFINWCKERDIDDPWAIAPIQLYNVHVPDDQTDFSHYLKKVQQATNNSKSLLAGVIWSNTSYMFTNVINHAKLPSVDADLITPNNPVNPFEGLPLPFSRKNPGGRKTPRSRLLAELQECLVEELLSLETQKREVYLPLLDDDGKPLLDDEGYPVLDHEPTLIEVKVPTFAWARSWAEEAYSTDRSKARNTDWYKRDGEWHWNPSASVALAILLLVPLRGKQVRWLDQGQLDSEVFDLSSGRMIENTHPLTRFRYANGENQEDFYGSLSGVLQVHADELNGAQEPVIWSSTNKTALWDGCNRTGYALPWPDGQALMLSDDEEVQMRGQHLARVYEVLRYQYEYMAKHDPNPSPINFSHISEDKKYLPTEEDWHQNLPWFVPLCRQLGNNEINVTWPNGEVHRASQPVSKYQIEKLYNALCLRVERKLRDKDKRFANVLLTDEAKISDPKAAEGRKARYDIHSLRVAGISRLIELGVPAHLVSEYVAGHQTVVMTMHYFQTTPMHMRKELMEALLEGDIVDGFEAVIERLANADGMNSVLPPARQSRVHVEDLPPDLAAIAPVPGGICLMGGEGSRCDVCAVKYRETENGHISTEYGQQLGGCAGGRFYRTGPDFALQQALEANKLMVLLRRKARERKAAVEELKALNEQIRELEMDIEMGYHNLPLAKMQKQLDNLKLRHQSSKYRLDEMNELQAPLIAQWYQRWQDFTDSQELEAELANEDASGQMVLIGDSDHVDFTPEIAASNDFGLVRTVLEQALCYKRTGITMPEDCRMLVDQFLNRIFAVEDPQLLMLFNQHRSAQEQDYLSGMLANLVSTVFGDDKVQLASEGGLKLGFNSELKESVKALCEKPNLLAMPDHRGKFSNLQSIEIRVEQPEAESPVLEHF